MARLILDARLIPLSPSLDAVVTARGQVLLIRSQTVFRLDDREARKLVEAVTARPPLPSVD